MGTFDAECSQCGSTNHASSDCPHGLYSTACSTCGSKDHASTTCPHGLFSTACSKCGSKSHASSDCPHGLYSSECSKCGSKNHASSDCPHGLYSSECSQCGSKEHGSSDCPHGLFTSKANHSEARDSNHSSGEESSTGTELIGKILGVVVVIAVVLWFVFSVAIPLLVINVALLALITAHVKLNLRKWLLPLSVFGAVLVVADYNAGWSTKTLVTNVTFFAPAIPVLVYLNLLAGLAALYYLVRDYLNSIKPPVQSDGEFSRRNLAIMGCLLVVGAVTAGVQEHFQSVARSGIPPSQAANIEGATTSPSPITKSGSTMTHSQRQPASSDKNGSHALPTANSAMKLTAFSSIPSYIVGCSSFFSESKNKYLAKQYIYADDTDEHATIEVNNKAIVLNGVVPDDPSYLAQYSNGEYTVYLVIDKTADAGRESSAMTGRLVLKHKSGFTIATAIYGERGC